MPVAIAPPAQIIGKIAAAERQKPLQPTGGHRRGAPLTQRAGIDQPARTVCHRKVMGLLTDAPLRRLQTDLRFHDPGQEGIVGRLSRPGTFVQTAENDGVDMLQPRFQRSEDEDPGWRKAFGLTADPAISASMISTN